MGYEEEMKSFVNACDKKMQLTDFVVKGFKVLAKMMDELEARIKAEKDETIKHINAQIGNVNF